MELIIVSVLFAMLAGYNLASWWYRFDTKREERKRHAFELAARCEQMGLTWLPEVLKDYGSNDWDDVLRHLAQAHKVMSNDKEFAAYCNDVRKRLVIAALGNPEESAALRKIIADFDAEAAKATTP